MVRIPDSLKTDQPYLPSYTLCECRYLKFMANVETQAGYPVRKALKGRRICAGKSWRKFPPTLDRSVPIVPNTEPANNGFGTADQLSLLSTLAKKPLAGYCFLGPTGVGKTFLMFALAKEAAYAGRLVIIRKAATYIELEKIRQTSDYHDDVLPQMIESNLDLSGVHAAHLNIYFDEIENVAVTEFSVRKMFEFLDWCYEHQDRVHLSVAGNTTMEQWEKSFSPAARRRIDCLCARITIGVTK